MIESWLRLPIYLNGEKCFEANPRGDLSVVDALKRMDFVFDNIEFCFAEGRLMDIDIFDRLDDLKDRIRANDIPPFDEIKDLVNRIGSLYGFDRPGKDDSIGVRRGDCGNRVISIDRDRIVEESNAKLFAKLFGRGNAN